MLPQTQSKKFVTILIKQQILLTIAALVLDGTSFLLTEPGDSPGGAAHDLITSQQHFDPAANWHAAELYYTGLRLSNRYQGFRNTTM